MTDLSAHPVHAIPPVGDPYVLGRWHRDRVSARGYLLEARVALKALVVRGRPERFLILARLKPKPKAEGKMSNHWQVHQLRIQQRRKPWQMQRLAT